MRPRLADHVQARLYRRRGETVVVLRDARTGGEATVGLREWRLLACCDGTRDLEGVVLAAQQRGARTVVAELARFLDALAAAGMVDDGPLAAPHATAPDRAAPDRAAPDRAALDRAALDATLPRTVVPLPSFTLECDGRGTCCRFYDTIVFRPDEVLRARALAGEVLDCGAHPTDAFTPERGSARVPWRASAVSRVEGRCAFLEGDGGCRLHRRGGAAAKPIGCRLFPLTVVDDGRALRATPRPECACVFASARVARDPAIDPTVEPAVEPLDPAAHVAVVGAVGDLDRERYLAWADGLALAADVVDGVAWLRAQAAQLDGGVDAGEMAAFARRLDARSRGAAADDLATRCERWARAALDRLVEDAPPSPDEGFYLRAVAHGHLWALDGVSLPAALRRRALVLAIARRLPTVYDGPRDPAQAHPLALVEALARKLGFLGAAV